MGKIFLYILSAICCIEYGLVNGEEKEVLIRDRLVMVLCDQMDDYLKTGTLPEPVKLMPKKYINFKPGTGDTSLDRQAGRSLSGMNNITAKSSGSGRTYNVVDASAKDKDAQIISKMSRYRRDTLQEDFDACQRATESCILDLNDSM